MSTAALVDPLDQHESIYRRVHLSYFDGSLELPVMPDAFKPTKSDDAGLSVIRTKLTSSPEDALAGVDASKRNSYCVCKLSVADFHRLSLQVIADPLPGIPGHALVPQLNTAAYSDKANKHAVRDKMLALARIASANVVFRPNTELSQKNAMVEYRPDDKSPIARMPIDELTPDVMYINLLNTNESYYIPADGVQLSRKLFWPQLPEAAEQIAMEAWNLYAQQYLPLTADKWLLGFRSDCHPWREISLWRMAADVYQRAIRRYNASTRDKKASIHSVLSIALRSRNLEDAVSLARKRGGWLNNTRIREIVREYSDAIRSSAGIDCAIAVYLALVPDRSIPIIMTPEETIAFIERASETE